MQILRNKIQFPVAVVAGDIHLGAAAADQAQAPKLQRLVDAVILSRIAQVDRGLTAVRFLLDALKDREQAFGIRSHVVPVDVFKQLA